MARCVFLGDNYCNLKTLKWPCLMDIVLVVFFFIIIIMQYYFFHIQSNENPIVKAIWIVSVVAVWCIKTKYYI